MTTFNAQAGFQPDADSIARRLNALESGTGISLVGPLLFPNGSATAPSIGFATQSGTGFAYVGNLTAYANGVSCAFFLPAGDFHTSQRLGIGGGGAQDTWLNRDAANTLALRNGTAAQTFNLYNTYTDASNYERLVIAWSSNTASIFSDNNGTGTNRNLSIGTLGVGTLGFIVGGVGRLSVTASALVPVTDNAYDLGSSTGRVRNGYLSGALNVGAAALVAPAGSVSIGATTTTTVGAAGAASALPTAPTGYLVINVAGTTQRIPYYN